MAKSKPMQDAIALLKADHRKVEGLFEKYEKSRGKKAEIAQQICIELSVHTTIEEEILYPACQEAGVEEDMLDEAYVEHDGAKIMIAQIREGKPEDEFYDAKVKVLSEEIKHHVKEEEQRDGLFAQLKSKDVDLKALGAQMAARKQELLAEIKESGLPAPMTRTMQKTQIEFGQPIA
jgi:hypothetical protein